MDIDLAALPDDVQTLHRMVRSLAVERTALATAQAEIERLRLIVQKLQRNQFGRRAERLDGDQLQFGFEDLEVDLARVEAQLPLREEKHAGEASRSLFCCCRVRLSACRSGSRRRAFSFRKFETRFLPAPRAASSRCGGFDVSDRHPLRRRLLVELQALQQLATILSDNCLSGGPQPRNRVSPTVQLSRLRTTGQIEPGLQQIQ
jgi:hypothetical protein